MEFKIIKKTPDYTEFEITNDEMQANEPPTIEIANGNLEKVEIIVREHADEYRDGKVYTGRVSTVGLKFVYRGQQYGNFVKMEKPTLSVAEVVESTNELLLWFSGTLNDLEKENTEIEW